MSQVQEIRLDKAEKVTLESDAHANPKTSVLYHLLPATVQSRMPILPSFRRSVRDFGTLGLQSKSSSTPEIALPRTPPPDYTSRPTSVSTTPNWHRSVASTSVSAFENGLSIAGSEPATFPQTVFTYEGSTGINWQHARHGMLHAHNRLRRTLILHRCSWIE
jgi:hypothetical protein